MGQFKIFSYIITMNIAYAKDKQKLVDKYLRLKDWYVTELQSSIRSPYVRGMFGDEPRPEPDPLPDRANWSGAEFWESCLNTELKKLDLQYEKYLPKPAFTYMWVGIDPDIKLYPTMLSLYEKLDKLQGFEFKAVVEGHTENGYRPHIHMILFTKICPNRIIKTFSKHFRCAENFVEAKNFKCFYEDKLDYIKGNKKKDKLDLVKKDMQERQLNRIPDLIEK